MARRHELVAGPGDAGTRLDVYLAGKAEVGATRSHLQRLIKEGLVTVNGGQEKAGYRLKPGDVIGVSLPDPEPAGLVPEDMPLDIVYEDQDILVINKPRGVVVHPAPGHGRGTLVNAILAHCPDLGAINDVVRPGVVHRLDKDTTGLLVVAKNEEAYRALVQDMKERRITREYLALVHGQPPGQGVIDAPVGRHPVHRKRMAVVERGGRRAVTHYKVLERFPAGERGAGAGGGSGHGPGYALIAVVLETGRTHQIRVHMAHIGHPVAGDPTYGCKQNPLGLPGQALHAFRLALRHPRTGDSMEFEAPLPPDLTAVIERLRAGAEPGRDSS